MPRSHREITRYLVERKRQDGEWESLPDQQSVWSLLTFAARAANDYSIVHRMQTRVRQIKEEDQILL